MHGREGEEGSKHPLGFPHMRAQPSRLRPARDSDGSLSSSSSPTFFCKDGRKISVGDCALFKLPHDSPPSIGLLCRVTLTKEKNLRLSVNWLYRPTEVKLGKGIELEAAPNEIFYSLKKDEIPAASLLHPCKVAFLPKGVELPSGISSFVCRRAYDIENRRLWWLTDKEHFNEEIDQLLHKTQTEMHASAQPNGRSPKQATGQMPASHVKPTPDSVQNASPLLTQSKGKKRERPDQSTDIVKRERLSKTGESDTGRCSSEALVKPENAKVVDRGPLTDTEGVDRLVQAMHFEINERRIDLSARTMLTSIVAATEKSDCLSRFVQIRGLSILDDWLQDVHKGKTGDCSGLKDNDKLAEEFLLVLLRALDKLPVNLPALQMCNIGKSVNHLRTHKNLEIQKKARSLVDKWKKRVEAEMNINDTKVGSNQAISGSARSRLPEAPHVNKSAGASPEGAPKSPSVQLSASKTAPAKLLQGEMASRSMAQSPGSMKVATSETSAGGNTKDGQSRISSSLSDIPLTTSRDEKSSSSSPSHNSSQSFPSDHARTGGSVAKSTAATPNKMPCLASLHRKSVNGVPASVASTRESGLSRTASLHKNVAPDKASQSGLTSEKAADVAPEVNSHKFIVKIPNRGRSPSQRAAGRTVDDNSVMNSRPSSPAVLEGPGQLDVLGEKADVAQANIPLDANTGSWQIDDCRDSLITCKEGDGQVDPGPNEDNCNTSEINKKTVPVSKNIASPRNTLRLGKVPETSISPMKALLESCVDYAEASPPVPIGDNTGMQLLASVAAGEVFKSESASPGSPALGKALPVDSSCKTSDVEVKPFPQDSQSRYDQSSKGVVSESILKEYEGSGISSLKVQIKASPSCFAEQSAEEQDKVLDSSNVDVDQAAALCSGSNKTRNNSAAGDSVYETFVHSEEKESKKNVFPDGPHVDDFPDEKDRTDTSNLAECRAINENPVCESKEETAAVGSLSGKEGMKLEIGSRGQVEAQPTKISLSEAINGREMTMNDALNEETVAGPPSGKEEHVVNEKTFEKAGGAVSDPSSHLAGVDIDTRGKSSGSDVSKKEADDVEKCSSSRSCASLEGSSDRDPKLEFDLNEGFGTEDGKFGESIHFNAPSATAIPLVNPLALGSASSSISLSAPIAVAAAAAKRSFVPPDDLLRAKVEIGWKGSAATSAFRPAEPRKIMEMPTVGALATPSPDISSGRQSRPILDFDLNVADERIIEDAAPQNCSRSNFEMTPPYTTDSAPSRASGGLGLDLNCVDEAPSDHVNYSTSNGRKQDSGAFRDFDLNDRPVIDAAEPSTSSQQLQRSGVLPHQLPSCGLRVNSAEMGNFSTWFHPANNYSALTVPSILSDRVEQPLHVVAGGAPPRMLGPSGASGIPFSTDMYRGPVLSSSPAMSFPSAPFQYSIFPFGTSFPLPPATLAGNPATYVDPSQGGRLGFPPVHSQLMGSSGPVTPQFSRPYMVSLSDCIGNSAVESSKKSSHQGLDLNSGPGGPDLEGRDETAPLRLRQLSLGGPQAIPEEQARLYQMNNGLLKRKEPEGGWDGYRHTSWQQ